jgi:RNA polymerase sigma factor (sigma-70 family)
VYAAPVVRQTLRQKLGFYVNQLGINPYNPDAEDLYHEIFAKIIEVLRTLPESPRPQIDKFEHYVAGIAANACLDYMRAKSPSRTRLKYSIREILNRKSEFFVRKSEEGFVCGLKRWTNQQRPISSQRLSEIELKLSTFRTIRFEGEDIVRVPLSKLTAELLLWIAEPIEVDDLVNITSVLLGVKDRPIESIDDETKTYLEAHIADTTLISDPGLDFERLLRNLWRAVLALSKNQKDTFCLRFESDSGEDLFTLLFEAEITTPPQLAEQMARSLEDLMRLWAAMPMEYADIANELNLTVLQVRKSRFDALRRLEKEENLRPFLRQK